MSFVEGVNLQNCPIDGRLNFFWCGNEKMQKNDFFHKTLISQNLLKEANIQARSMESSRPELSENVGLIGHVTFKKGVKDG